MANLPCSRVGGLSCHPQVSLLMANLLAGRAGSGRAGPGRVGSGRVGSGRVGSGRVRSGRVRSGRIGSGRVRSGRIGSGRVRSGRVRSGRIGSGRVRSGRIGSGRVRSSPAGSGRVRPGRVGVVWVSCHPQVSLLIAALLSSLFALHRHVLDRNWPNTHAHIVFTGRYTQCRKCSSCEGYRSETRRVAWDLTPCPPKLSQYEFAHLRHAMN